MAKKYNPWTGFLEDTNPKANDSKTCDGKNEYEIHYTVPGKTGTLVGSGKGTSEQEAKEDFMAYHKSENPTVTKVKLYKSLDKAIRNCDAGEERWITMNGSHIKIDGEGNAVAGNEKVKSIINKGKNTKGNSKGSSSSSYTPAKNYNDFKSKTGAEAVLQDVDEITYERENERRSFTEKEIDKIAQGILDVFEKGKDDPNFGKYVNKIRKEVNGMFDETSGTTLYDYVFEGEKDENKDTRVSKVLKIFNKYR